MNIKKSLLLLSTAVIYSFANVADTQEYKDGVSAFNQKDYQKSEKIFIKLFEQDSANTQVNFYLGRIYYELGLFEKALTAYDRVLIMDEEHARTKLELGRTYISLHMLKDAKKIFNEVLESNAPDSVKKNVEKVLETIDKFDARSKFNFLLGATIGYDDNINSNAGSENIKSYMSSSLGLDPTKVTTDDKIGSIYLQELFNVRNSYDFGRRDGWFLESSFILLNQNFKRKDYDLIYKNMSVGPAYQTKDYKLSLPFTYDHVDYAHDRLLHSLYIQPKLDLPIDKSTLLNAYVKYQKKMYFQSTNREKNARVTESGITLTKTISKNNAIQGGYVVSREERLKGTAVHVNKLSHGLTVAYMTKLFDLDVKAQCSYKKINYFETYLGGSENRDDRNYSYLLNISKKINSKLNMNFSYNNMKSFSNYTPVTYNKNNTSVSLNYMF